VFRARQEPSNKLKPDATADTPDDQPDQQWLVNLGREVNPTLLPSNSASDAL
jgi:hypothetical protein